MELLECVAAGVRAMHARGLRAQRPRQPEHPAQARSARAAGATSRSSTSIAAASAARSACASARAICRAWRCRRICCRSSCRCTGRARRRASSLRWERWYRWLRRLHIRSRTLAPSDPRGAPRARPRAPGRRAAIPRRATCGSGTSARPSRSPRSCATSACASIPRRAMRAALVDTLRAAPDVWRRYRQASSRRRSRHPVSFAGRIGMAVRSDARDARARARAARRARAHSGARALLSP